MSQAPRHSLFVYGTLAFAAVQDLVLGRVPAAVPATALGWRAAALRDRPFPGLVPSPGGQVTGMLLTGLDEAEEQRVHDYEGSMYRRQLIPLEAEDPGGPAGETPQGWTYVCVEEELVLPENWAPDRFAAERLEGYLEHCRRWAAAR